jgi:hypothetical protein
MAIMYETGTVFASHFIDLIFLKTLWHTKIRHN